METFPFFLLLMGGLRQQVDLPCFVFRPSYV